MGDPRGLRDRHHGSPIEPMLDCGNPPTGQLGFRWDGGTRNEETPGGFPGAAVFRVVELSSVDKVDERFPLQPATVTQPPSVKRIHSHAPFARFRTISHIANNRKSATVSTMRPFAAGSPIAQALAARRRRAWQAARYPTTIRILRRGRSPMMRIRAAQAR